MGVGWDGAHLAQSLPSAAWIVGQWGGTQPERKSAPFIYLLWEIRPLYSGEFVSYIFQMLLQYLCSFPSKELRIHLNNELPRSPGKQPVGFTNEAFWMKERIGGAQSRLARGKLTRFTLISAFFFLQLKGNRLRGQRPLVQVCACPAAATGTQASLCVPLPRASAGPL